MKFYNKEYPEPISTNAVEILKISQSIHKQFLSFKRCPANTGSKKWHKYWIAAYEAVLKKLDERSEQ